jgi:hypothetical protein
MYSLAETVKQLEDDEEVCVNLRPDADPETEYDPM